MLVDFPSSSFEKSNECRLGNSLDFVILDDVYVLWVITKEGIIFGKALGFNAEGIELDLLFHDN